MARPSKSAAAVSLLMTVSLLVSLCLSISAAEEKALPSLAEVQVEQKGIHPGGSVRISARIDGGEVGVQSILLYFEGQGKTLSCELRHNLQEEEDVFSAMLQVPADALPGAYILRSATLRDEKGQRVRYDRDYDESRGRYPLDTEAYVTVVSPEELPRLEDCQVLQKQDGFWVSLMADCPSGGLERAELLFENGANYHKIDVTLTQEDQEADGRYQKRIEIPSYEPAGYFSLKRVSLTDQAGNEAIWQEGADGKREEQPLLQLPSFTVQPREQDVTPPVLAEVSVGAGVRDEAAGKLLFPITVTAEDDLSGVELITLKFKNQQGKNVSKTLQREDQLPGYPDRYAGEIAVAMDREPDEYRLDSVTLADYAGNRITYSAEEDPTGRKLPLPVTASFTTDF